MKNIFFIYFICCIISCHTKTPPIDRNAMEGTWRLISSTTIEKGDTSVTYYNKNRPFIKIINKTHFAFLYHNLDKGQDSIAIFSAGGGSYSFSNYSYTEHLEYCSDRDWEDHEFNFKISFIGDTMLQTGIEKIENLKVDRMNIERYVKSSTHIQ